MRWVLIRPCNRSPYYDPEIQEPLGAEYLAATLEDHGHRVMQLDAAFDGGDEIRLARRAAAFRPDALGFSITTAQELPSVSAILEECRRIMPGDRLPHLAAGGNFVSTEPSHAEACLASDIVLVRFEGEGAIADLAQRWSAEPAPAPASVRNPVAPRVIAGASATDLEVLPLPLRPYIRDISESGGTISMQGSRGCCGACRFCAAPGMRPSGAAKWRGRSPSHIVDEIEMLGMRHGVRSFNFIDEDFLGPNSGASERAARFADELVRRRLRITFGMQVRPDSLDADSIVVLRRAGLQYVFMGLESDDPDDFRRWGRKWVPDPWIRIRRLRDCGVEVNVGVMLFHPHATFAGIRRFARLLHAHGLLEYRSAINRLDAMPGSTFHADGIRDGVIDPLRFGPQPLPFVHQEIEPFYTDLLAALSPLGPPSMHALCSLPLASSRARLLPRADAPHRVLKHIIGLLDAAAARSFFAVLDSHERGVGTHPLIDDLRQRNLVIAIDGASQLVRHGFASSLERLREAIRVDSGI